jgi:hypothetical protein
VRRTFAVARPTVYAAASGWFVLDAALAVKKQFDDQSTRMEAWATAERAQVESGALSLERWLSFGEAYARFASGTVRDAYNATAFAVVKDTVTTTATDIAGAAANAGNPPSWPLGWKLAAAGVALVVVLVVAAPYVRAAGALK